MGGITACCRIIIVVINILFLVSKYYSHPMTLGQISRVMRKPVFEVSDQARHKPGCTSTEEGKRLEISDLVRRGIVLYISENKGADQLRSVTAPLFSHV